MLGLDPKCGPEKMYSRAAVSRHTAVERKTRKIKTRVRDVEKFQQMQNINDARHLRSRVEVQTLPPKPTFWHKSVVYHLPRLALILVC